MPYILRYADEGIDKTAEFDHKELILGRSPDCGLVLAQPGVSRHHCKIFQDGDGYAIEDLHSKNGTRVNNVYINKSKLSNGDQILVAEFPLIFQNYGTTTASVPLEETDANDEMVFLSDEKQLHEESGTIIRKANEVQEILANYEQDGSVSRPRAHNPEASRIINFVIEVAQALIAVKSVDEIIKKLMDLIFDNLPADRGCIMLRNEQGVLQSRAVRRRQPKDANVAIEFSKTIANKALNDKMSILSTDAQIDPRFSAGESIRFQGIKSAMCVPLFHKQKTIGIIYLDSPSSAAMFAPTDLDLLTAAANFAAVGIEQAMLSEKIQEEMNVRERLERYHSPSIVSRILSELDEAKSATSEFHLSAEERDVTVLFADIVGFTPMSARLSPGRIAELLNEYFSEMTEVIFAYEGTLDKYIGDAIMAIFGAPNTMEDHAYRAVCTALDMLDRLSKINVNRPEEDRFAIRVGINSGRAVAGDIGSIKRMEYTVLGNTVNVAARIESTACKANQVVIGEPTYELVKEHFAAKAFPIRLKGISEQATVYNIIGRK